MVRREHQLPTAVREALDSGSWPLKVIPGSIFSPVHPVWSSINIELLKDSGEILIGGSKNADLETLIEFAGDVRLSEQMRLLRGSENHEKNDLPWLDVEQALVIGGGADYGDDLWLVMDYRRNALSPRVIFNVYDERGRASWMVLTESVELFLSRVGVAPAAVFPANGRDTSMSVRKPWWKFW